MKKFRIYSILLFTAIALFSMSSCSKEDEEATVADLKVVINSDGTTSNDGFFYAIDDKNFYLDYIKYTIVERHIIVSGYDKTSFKGKAMIPSRITYKQNTYEVLGIKYETFCECSSLTSIVIPNSVTSIGRSAFSGCTGLTSIVIPNGVTSIENEAFSGCTGLTSIVIPNSVTSIGRSAFSGCTGLTSITIPNSLTTIEQNAFLNCTGLTSINIPNSVISIGREAFASCTGLTSITIPNSVTSIEDYAFGFCPNLEQIVVSNGNTTYDSRDNCNAIIETATNTLLCGCKNTIIPNSVTSIEDWAFSGCSGLTSITIPNSVTSIGTFAFNGCSGLTAIHCLSTTPPSISSYGGTFDNDTYSKATLYVPQGSLEAYKNAAGWGMFQNIVEE